MKFRTGTKNLRVILRFLRKRRKDKLFVIGLLSSSISTSNKYIPNLKFSCIFMNLTIFEITFFYFRKVNVNEPAL